MRSLWTIAGMLALTGCAATGGGDAPGAAQASRELGEALAGRTAGAPQDCVQLNGLSGPRIIDDRTILYTSGRRIWRADLPDACPSLQPFATVISEVRGGQMCRNDPFRTVAPGVTIPSGYCRFGSFTPYTKAE